MKTDMKTGMKIGILKECKIPQDFRVPFTPNQMVEMQKKFNVKCVVQSSDIRCFKDSEYTDLGIALQEDLSDCDIIFGVKEVPIENLITGKTYVFFSHVIKEQEHNVKLMHALIEKNITMIDYETLLGPSGQRLTAFGREAGIVGAYNALRAYGLKFKTYTLPLAQDNKNLVELYDRVSKIPTPAIKILSTGRGGRVSCGVVSVLEKAGFKSVSADTYLNTTVTGVFVALAPCQYIKRADGSAMVKAEFFADPTGFVSNFMPYAKVSDIYVSGHFWDRRSTSFFEMSDIADKKNFPIEVLSDVSCDLPGPIPTTLRETTMDDTTYDIDRSTGKECPEFSNPNNLTVTAVDNLPSSIPRDASFAFGGALIAEMLPYYLGDDDGRIEKATICSHGTLKPTFTYLRAYAGLN